MVRLEADRDHLPLSGEVSDRLFAPHQSSLVCTHTGPKGSHQAFFSGLVRTKQCRCEYAPYVLSVLIYVYNIFKCLVWCCFQTRQSINQAGSDWGRADSPTCESARTDSRMGEHDGALVAQTACEADPPSGELYQVNDEQNICKRRRQSSSSLFMLLSRSRHLFGRFHFIAFLLLHKHSRRS